MPNTLSPDQKRLRIFYWILTILFTLPMLLTGLMEFAGKADPTSMKTVLHLGYPEYIPRIIGFWKLGGVITILALKFRFLKEWAYAGFGMLYINAIASHALRGDALDVPAFIMLAIAFGSYLLWCRINPAPEAASNPPGYGPQ